MSIGRMILRLAGLRSGRVREMTRVQETLEAAALDAALREDQARFADQMALRCRVGHVELGEDALGVPYVLPLRELAGTFAWLTAGTGSGKSRLIGGMLAQLMAQCEQEGFACVLLDLKGELSDLTLRAAAAHARGLSGVERERFLGERLTTVRFFGEHLPEWQLLAPETGVNPVVQAHAIAEALEATVAADLGIRQASALTAILALAIESRLSFLDLRFLLYDRQRLINLASRSALPEVKLYVQTRLARESAMTLDGLAARCDALLRIESVKAALAGPGMLDLGRCFAPGAVTVFDFGGAPLGAESSRKALACLALTRLVWSTFDPARSQRAPCLIFADEVQEALSPATTHHLERLLTTGRSFGVGFWSVHQAATQLPTDVQSLLNTNVQIRVLGQSGEADARAAAEWMPRSGRVRRPRAPGRSYAAESEFLTEGEERAHWINEVGRLPRRSFLVADRRAPFHGHVIRAGAFAPPEWSELPRELADAVRRGSASRPRAEMLARAAEIESRAAADLEDGAMTAPRAASTPKPTPDAVGGRTRGRGAVP